MPPWAIMSGLDVYFQYSPFHMGVPGSLGSPSKTLAASTLAQDQSEMSIRLDNSSTWNPFSYRMKSKILTWSSSSSTAWLLLLPSLMFVHLPLFHCALSQDLFAGLQIHLPVSSFRIFASAGPSAKLQSPAKYEAS